MPKITFERVLRDCGHNDSIKAGHRNSITGKLGKLLYDFKVMIDGEHRADMRRIAYGVGYEVEDADRRPIRWPGNRQPYHVRNRASFEHEIAVLLSADLIPTLAELAAQRDTEAREKAATEARERAERRARRIQACGVELYDTMKLIAEKATGKRQTINPQNAFEIAAEMNKTLIAIRDLAASAMAMTLEDAS